MIDAATSTLIAHFIEYMFIGGHGEPWYHAAIWGNIFVLFVAVPLGWLGLWWHKREQAAFHRSHDAKLKKLLEALDPEIESDTQIDHILELVDETTPGGAGTILEEIKKLSGRAGRGTEGAASAQGPSHPEA